MGRKTTQPDGQVTERELARILSHYRRMDSWDIDTAAGLLERFDIRPKETSS